jgi:hypothetical protein
LLKPRIAQAAGGFFDAFGGLAGARGSFSGCVDVVRVKRKRELSGEGAHEIEVGVRLCSAKTVVKMRYVEHEAQSRTRPPALLMKRSEECDGIGSSGDADDEAQARIEEGGVERKQGRNRHRMDDIAVCSQLLA